MRLVETVEAGVATLNQSPCREEDMPFKSVLKEVKRSNAERLKSKARSANALAKITELQARSALYSVKSEAITRLLEMRVAVVGEMLFESDVIVGLWFEGGGGLHVRFRDLSPSGQKVVLEQLEDVLSINDSTPTLINTK